MHAIDGDKKSKTSPMRAVEFVVNALVECGVTHVFGGHGGAIVPLVDEIMKNPHLTWVYCRCEVNASQAAAAYAKLHGRLGCCVATSGPGSGHLLSGIVDADQDRVPMIVLTGLKNSGNLRYADFQDIDQASVFRAAGLPFSENVANVAQLMPLTRNALTLATTANRCVHLAMPVDIQQQKIQAPSHFCLGTTFRNQILRRATDVDVSKLTEVCLKEVTAGHNVLICCGWRARPYGKLIERMAELLRAPILTSFDSKGTVD